MVSSFELASKLLHRLHGMFDKDGWVRIHNSCTRHQCLSRDAMLWAHQMGYDFDIVTNDGKELTRVDLNDSRIKLEYNVNSNIVTYPENGIQAWRLSPTDWKTPISPVRISPASAHPYFNESVMDQALSPGRLTIKDFEQIVKHAEKVGPHYANDKYKREIKPGVFVDVYDVLDCFEVHSGALQHALKKILATGKRGHKTYEQDLIDILSSVERALIQHQEKKL